MPRRAARSACSCRDARAVRGGRVLLRRAVPAGRSPRARSRRDVGRSAVRAALGRRRGRAPRSLSWTAVGLLGTETAPRRSHRAAARGRPPGETRRCPGKGALLSRRHGRTPSGCAGTRSSPSGGPPGRGPGPLAPADGPAAVLLLLGREEVQEACRLLVREPRARQGVRRGCRGQGAAPVSAMGPTVGGKRCRRAARLGATPAGGILGACG